MRNRLVELKPRAGQDPTSPDLHTQLEELFCEVWAQESFERAHPLTCATMREPVTRSSGAARVAA